MLAALLVRNNQAGAERGATGSRSSTRVWRDRIPFPLAALSNEERPLRDAHVPAYLLLSATLFASTLVVAVGFLQARPWQVEPVLTAIVAFLLALTVPPAVGKWLLLPTMRRPAPQAVPEGLRVAAVTTYVPGAEPLEMADCTLRAMLAMVYPHECWLLDEGDDPAARALCAERGVAYFTRAGHPEYQTADGTFQSRSKHGNYNAWLAEVGYARYEVVVSFDLDHVPGRQFLTATLGHLRDPAVGYVQAPQAYYNQGASFVAAGAAEETYDFHSTVQMANHALGYPIVVGCHNVHRTQALRDVGGYAAHTADDVLITMLYRQRGWRGVYVPLILARGVTPVDWKTYLLQQRRWCRTLCDLKFRRQSGLLREMPMASRWLSRLHGVFFLQPVLTCTSVAALLVATLAAGRAPLILSSIPPWAWLALVAALLACDLFRQQFFLDPAERGLRLRSRFLRIVKAPALAAGVWDALSTRAFDFTITRKSGAARDAARTPKTVALGAMSFALLVALAWAWGAARPGPYPVWIHGLAGVALVASVATAATDWINFPPPFERSLLVRKWAPWLA